VHRGRRWVTDELNHSLILRLATEFQGFARDLHNETSIAVVRALSPDNEARQSQLLIPYFNGRRLDRGNAQPTTLHEDFALFGMKLWSELEARHAMRSTRWRAALTVLNHARNGIAHDDAGKIADARASGWLLTLSSVHRWRRALDGLTTAMDDVVGQHIRQIIGTRPW
jgi:hypothetical protein